MLAARGHSKLHVLLALVACLLAACAAGGLGFAWAAGDDEVTVEKLSATAYLVDDDGEWDTSEERTTISEKGGKVRIAVTATLSDGTKVEETDAKKWKKAVEQVPALDEGFEYDIGSSNLIKVSKNGTVTARKNGRTRVTVKPAGKGMSGLSAPLDITCENQNSNVLKGIEARAYKIVSGTADDWDLDSETKKITRRGQQLRIAVVATWEGGVEVSETNEEKWLAKGGFSKGFTYECDTDEFIKVNSKGVITAVANGETVVTVTPNDSAYEKHQAKITITTKNQDAGLMVTKVEIVDRDGMPYGDDNLKVADKNTVKLYARVTYKDKADDKKVVYSNCPSAPSSEQPPNGAFDGLEWSVSDDIYCGISKHKDAGKEGVGYFKATANARVNVFLSITGGDSDEDNGMGYGVVVDRIGVNIEIPGAAGRVGGEMPADKLTVKIVYEKDLETVVEERTYTVAEFEALGAVTKTYTLTRTSGEYVTDKAYGVPIATLLMAFKVDVNDVKYFTLAANDGANPGKITAKWLLKKARYYLPNYDLGGSWQEKKQVPSMIATKDSWNSNTVLTGDFNAGTRFRLLFGSATSSDNATSKSIKFINTFTIVMEGAAPAQTGNDKEGASTTKTDANDKSVDAEETPQEQTQQQQQQQGQPPQQQQQQSKQQQTDEGAPKANTQSNTQGTAPFKGRTIGPSSDPISDEPVQQLDDAAQWRIYQMMNKSNSELTPIDLDPNPLEPFVAPAALAVLLAAMGFRFLRYRRQLAG